MSSRFILTPYKIVAASFILRYFDWRIETGRDSERILQLSFELIMSLDLSYDELMNLINKSMSFVSDNSTDEIKIDSDIEDDVDQLIQEFQFGLSNLTIIDFLSSIIEKIDFSIEAPDKEYADMMRKRCHPKSLIGMFFRKIVLHFKRISFNEVTMLVHNLKSYISVENSSKTEKKTHGEGASYSSSSLYNFQFPTVPENDNDLGHRKLAVMSLDNLRAFEKKMTEEYKNSFKFRNNRNSGLEIRNQMIVLSKIIKQRESMKSDLLQPNEYNQNKPAEAENSDFNLSDALKDSEYKIDETKKEFEQIDNSLQDRKLNNITQQYLINQVNLMLTNEKKSLPPEEILNLVEHFYNKHHSFQYQQSIHSNYRMNIRMASKSAQLDSSSSLSNSDSGHGNDIANLFSKRFGDVQSPNNFHNDLYYLKFINALRMNDYPLAQNSLHQYFDNKDFNFSSQNDPFNKNDSNKKRLNDECIPGGMNNCWASLNIGIMHAHFGHYEAAFDALEDCVRIARDQNDNKCLQFEMIWMLYVLEKLEQPQALQAEELNRSKSRFWKIFHTIFDDTKNHNSSTITSEEYYLISNLMKLISINERKIPYVAAMGYLHLEKQLYKQQMRSSERHQPLSKLLSVNHQLSSTYLRPPLNIKPMLLSSRYMMDDVLQKQYSLHSALLNAYGAHHLASISSKLLSRMDFSGVLHEKRYAHCNENHAIAMRNIAFYNAKVIGDSVTAMRMLDFFNNYVTKYEQNIIKILETAKVEISFDNFLMAEKWYSAIKCIQTMKCYNSHYSGIMYAKLMFCRGNVIEALKCLDCIIGDEELSRISQNVEHNETLMKSFKKAKTTIQIKGEQKLRNSSKQSTKKKDIPPSSTSTSSSSETIIVQNGNSKLSVLSPELDPFMWLYAMFLKASFRENIFELFEILQLSQNWSFKQIEIKTELEIIRIQQQKFGQYREAQARLDELIIKILSSGILEDIGKAYYLCAVNHYALYKAYLESECSSKNDKPKNISFEDEIDEKELLKNRSKNIITIGLPLRMRFNDENDLKMYHLKLSRWYIMRSTTIYMRIQYKAYLLDCAYLGYKIEQILVKNSNKTDSKNDILTPEEYESKRRCLLYTNIIPDPSNAKKL